MIHYMKAEGLLDRNRLESALGDAMHAILCNSRLIAPPAGLMFIRV
jgi:hypothetical protein